MIFDIISFLRIFCYVYNVEKDAPHRVDDQVDDGLYGFFCILLNLFTRECIVFKQRVLPTNC